MVNYGFLSELERVIMGCLVVASTFLGIPLLKRLKREKLMVQFYVGFMLVFTSGMYHLSQVLNRPLLLEQLEWHRLDNMFAISSVIGFIMAALGNAKLVWIKKWVIGVAIVTQIIDPWNLNFTIFPIVGFTLLGIILRIQTHKKYIREYSVPNLIATIFFATIAIYYFIEGLEQEDDYLRFNHSMWHVFSSMFGYYGFFMVTVTQKQEDREDQEYALIYRQ